MFWHVSAYRPRYADTLQKIANSSADAFYSGEIAQSIVDTVQNTGGIMTIADLANYTAIEREPVNITYRNTRIFSTVAPSSGAVVLSALKVSYSRYQVQ
jgi:gamma-glutamyltranspeptidase/glutathione hydrolase